MSKDNFKNNIGFISNIISTKLQKEKDKQVLHSFIHSKNGQRKKSVLVFVIKSPFFLSSASMLSPHIISLFLPLHLVTHLERPLNMSTRPHHRDSPSERLIFLPPTTGGLSY
jgi:hypothetical protein